MGSGGFAGKRLTCSPQLGWPSDVPDGARVVAALEQGSLSSSEVCLAQEGGEGVGVCGKVFSQPWDSSSAATLWAAWVPSEGKGCGYDTEDLS